MGAGGRMGPGTALPIRSRRHMDTSFLAGGRTRGRTKAVGAIVIHVPAMARTAHAAVPTGGGKEYTDDGADVFETTKSFVDRDEGPGAWR